MEKRNSIKNQIYTLTRIIGIISLVGIVIGIVGSIIIICLPNDLFEGLMNRIKLSRISLVFEQPVITAYYAKMGIFFNAVRGLIISCFAFIIIYHMIRVVRNVVLEKYFEVSNVRSIKMIGITIMIFSFIPDSLNYFIDLYILKVAGAEKIIQQIGNIQSIGVELNVVNFAILIFGAVIFFFSQLFTRGNFLQEEYDSTL